MISFDEQAAQETRSILIVFLACQCFSVQTHKECNDTYQTTLCTILFRTMMKLTIFIYSTSFRTLRRRKETRMLRAENLT